MARSKLASAGVRVVRARGAKVSAPVPVVARRDRSVRAARRSGRKATGAGDSGRDVLLQALESQELRPTHEFTIAPAPAARSARRGAKKRAAPSVAVEVDVAPAENAIVLVEQDGD